MSEQAPAQIQHPDSIPHNFDQGQPIAVVDRSFHNSSEHPHPVNYFGEEDQSQEPDQTPEKQRGIVVTETTLGGKPFFVAERPSSKENSTEQEETTTKQEQGTPGTDIEKNDANSRKRQEALEKFLENYQKARDHYARVSAGRGKRAFLFGIGKHGYTKESLKEARDNFEEAQAAVIAQEVKIAHFDKHIPLDELKRVASAAAAENQWSLAGALYEARVSAAPKTPGGRAVRSFHEWWNKQDTKVGTAKKVATMAAAGFAIGVPVGIVAGPVLAAVAGGALGASFAKRISVNRMSLGSGQQNAKGEELSRAKAMDSRYQQRLIYMPVEHYGIYNDVSKHTERHVALNRKDTVLAVGSAAIGGLGGGLLGGEVIASNGAHSVVAHGHHQVASHHHIPKHHEASHKKPGATVNAHNIGNQYVSQVYEHAEGLHPGFTDMTHAANLAQHHGLIQVIHPNPNNPSQFYYKATKAGAKFAHIRAGSEKSTDILKILSHFGKLKLV